MLEESRSFTLRSQGLLKELRTPVHVSFNRKMPDRSLSLSAIWDTGATICSIQAEIAKKLGLAPIGYFPVGGVHGVQDVLFYIVDLYLPNNVVVHNVEACEMAPEAGCDVLIGMNVITMGDFAITNYKGKTMFSFRMPSFENIDFLKQIPQGYEKA